MAPRPRDRPPRHNLRINEKIKKGVKQAVFLYGKSITNLCAIPEDGTLPTVEQVDLEVKFHISNSESSWNSRTSESIQKTADKVEKIWRRLVPSLKLMTTKNIY